jgi:hypothetical protein
VGGKFSYVSSDFSNIDLVTNMTFHGTQSVKGKVGVNFAAFDPAIGHEKLISKTQACISPNQAFSATNAGNKAGLDLPAGTVMVGGPDGKTIHRLTLKP